MRKNLTSSEWVEINKRVGKRKLDGTDKEVILTGQWVDPKRLQRGMRRYKTRGVCNEIRGKYIISMALFCRTAALSNNWQDQGVIRPL